MPNQHSTGCRPKLSNGQGASRVAKDEQENNGPVPFLMYVKVILRLSYSCFACPKPCGRGKTLDGLYVLKTFLP